MHPRMDADIGYGLAVTPSRVKGSGHMVRIFGESGHPAAPHHDQSSPQFIKRAGFFRRP